jgi:hypothetical protein
VPFRSKAQVRLLFAKHPDVAKRWADEYGIPHDLPEHVKPTAKERLAKAMNDRKAAKSRR